MNQGRGRIGGSGSKISRSLLGSDAFVETGKARRVNKLTKKKKELGPLLNCTSESRRRAQEGYVETDSICLENVQNDEMNMRMVVWSIVIGVLAIVLQKRIGWSSYLSTLALTCWLIVAWQVYRLRQRNKMSLLERTSIAKNQQQKKKFGPHMLAGCYKTSERAPPLPLLELPENDIDEEWMLQAGIAPRWTATERKFLKRAKEQYNIQLQAPEIKYLDAYGDRRLLRFLRQDPTQDEDRALLKLGEYLNWRAKANIDQTTRKLVPEIGADPSKWPHGNILLECIRLIQCSDTYFSKQGFSVTVYQAFHWPAPALRKHVGSMTTKQLVEFATFGAEFNAVQMDRIAISRERYMLDHAKQLWFQHKKMSNESLYKRGEHSLPQRCDSTGSALCEQNINNYDPKFQSEPTTPQSPRLPWHRNETPLIYEGWGELTRLCAITDMAGCTFGSIAMPQLIPAVIQAVSLFVNYYPYIVGELHVINCAPLVARIFKRALNAVVPKHIADQVQIHVHTTELLHSVRPVHLPKHIGGDAECPALDAPPPPSSSSRQEQAQEKQSHDTSVPEDEVRGRLPLVQSASSVAPTHKNSTFHNNSEEVNLTIQGTSLRRAYSSPVRS
mmetsp:Transcript_21588/g.33120  ORF Transcript_21588/g.33120 Transcript_21588/m.33120 type:complete len:614 (-) Transcript_21588:151-1992(-)